MAGTAGGAGGLQGSVPGIVMLNGAFGAGKTTLAKALIERRPEWRLFDPEKVGFALRRLCLRPPDDFQEIGAWAPSVVAAARALVLARGRTLVVPMTLVDPRNHRAVRSGFESVAPTRHFALVASPGTLARRLAERGAERWAFEQIDRCASALDGPEFAVHLDAEKSVAELADEVLRALGASFGKANDADRLA